ncbi:MAG: hypothetical protein LH603_22085 [Pseudonocardia sp.]|nr:hypothetical protein [Pseudonocardia sp.]
MPEPDVRAVAFGALPHVPVHVRAGMLGGHAAARRDDALGLRLAAAAPVSPPDANGTDPWAARIDALVGLAADALGLAAPVPAHRLLDAATAAAVGHPSWRPRVRLGWVRAEPALMAGRSAEAVAPASAALAEAESAGSVRHVLRSRIVLAVARAAAGEIRPAAGVVELDAVADRCLPGLLPLHWPCLLAAADLTGPTRSAQRSANDTLADVTHRRHAATATISVVRQRSDPVGRRLLGESPWVPWRRGVTSLLHSEISNPHDERHSAHRPRMGGTSRPRSCQGGPVTRRCGG